MDVHSNELNMIPGGLLELPNLVDLNISHNKLNSLPRLSKWSPSLTLLDASFNRLTVILGEPTAPSICTLNLANNELTSVPQCIFNFTTLQNLDISNNIGISALPMQMCKLKELYHLNLKGLKNLTGLPRCIQADPKKIISYLKSKSLPAKGYYRMKLMLVGKQDRGKTTLVARLQGRNCGNTSTVGIDVSEWEYRPSIGKKSFQFSIWDFGGQEEYYATHQCFLSERAIYLVLFNLVLGANGVEELTPWLNNIALRAPNSCVIIVGTHLDEIPFPQREEKADKVLQKAADIAGRFTNRLHINQILAVGLKGSLEGVGFLKDSIYQCVAEYRLKNGELIMGQMIPVSYIKLDKHIHWVQKQARQCNRDPIMTKEEFRSLVKGLNLPDIQGGDELKLAASFLTDVGTLLHYDDRSHHLDELYFLDPRWLCDMMAKIVTVKERNPFVSNGILATKDIPFLFRGERFPWQYFKQYFALLDSFEIALALDTHRILIPSMLSEVRPEGVDIVETNDVPLYTRLVIFNSPTTPSGFWSRLISRIIHAIPSARGANHSCNPSADQTESTYVILQSDGSGNAFDPSLSVSLMDANSRTSMIAILDDLKAKIQYWRTGLFYQDNLLSFRVESLAHTKHKKEGIAITATLSLLGRKMVSQIVDFVNSLVKDWYTGLQDRGPLEQVVLCCECMKLKCIDPYQFDVQSCLSLIGQNITSIDCGTGNHSVPLADIVPDLLLQDISMKFLLAVSELDYKEDEGSVLGVGGFGKVYRGKCHGKSVAIKRYLNGDEALCELRKEAIILQRSHHPCLVCLVGVCVHPIMAMVLEEAPMGSLEKPLIKTKLPIHRVVIHRIAAQVAAALKFLHDSGIIFRDLKAANVLLWSLDPESLFHCKVTDFGIATSVTPIGARGLTGTKGFIAPEMLHVGKKKERSLYDHRVDIFSFGMLLYQLISRKHPFHDLLPVRIDSAVENGERPKLDDVPESENAYFYLTRLMQHCWEGDPRKRPTTTEIIDKLCLSSFQSVMSVKPVSYNPLQCKACAISEKVFSQTGVSHRETEVWIFSNNADGMEIHSYSAISMAMLNKSVIKGIKAECISLCGEQVWVATTDGIGNGVIDIFNIITRESVQKITVKNHSVSCMAILNQTVYCGTTNGFCLSFSKNAQRTQFVSNNISKQLSENVIDGILTTDTCLWLSHAYTITFVGLETLEVMGTLKRESYSSNFIGQLHISDDKAVVWSCQLVSTCIRAWSVEHKSHMFDIDIKDHMHRINQCHDELDMSITAVIPVLDTVWVGLESGIVLLFAHKDLLTWFQPYKSYVQFILCSLCSTEKRVLISGGKRFNHLLVPGLVEYEDATESETLVKWEAFSSKMSKQIHLVQSESSTFLENHETARSAIRMGAFKDCTFLADGCTAIAK